MMILLLGLIFICFFKFSSSLLENCSDEPVPLMRKTLTEEALFYENDRNDSFKEYLNLVYGETRNPTNFTEFDFDVLYKRSDIEFRFTSSRRTKVNKYVNPWLEDYIWLFQKKPIKPFKDYKWAEVIRASTQCFPAGKKWGDKWAEGLSKGFLIMITFM